MNSTEKIFNHLPREMQEDEFVEIFGGVYEHSPWIPRMAYKQGLNSQHDTSSGLSEAMMDVVANADQKRLLALINAHPDLAGKAAVSGELTEESTAEQSGAGINQCTPDEFERFQNYNNAYKEKFGFPFIMAVKGSNRHQILEAFEQRLQNDAETEFMQALIEINKIAKLRLDVLADEL
jgi:OHCU decarboxylase